MIYPPRPTNVITSDYLTNFNGNSQFVAQLKLNGSCCVYNKKAFTRHGTLLKGFSVDVNVNAVLVGEYMNKSKKDNLGQIFNHVLVLHDVLSVNDTSLVGINYEERYNTLISLFKIMGRYNDLPILKTNSNKVYIFENMTGDFTEMFHRYKSVDMIEGLVVKRVDSLLQTPNRASNNTAWQFKVRKPTKNYTC